MTRPLRIMQVLSSSTNDAVASNTVWRRNLHDPLVELGHDVVLLPAEDGRKAMASNDARPRARFSQAVLTRFQREHAKRPSERDVGDKFRRIGATPLWWPMASNPQFAHPVDVQRRLGASFVGGNYGLRAEYALHLLDNGVDLHLFGPGWTLSGSVARVKRRLRRDLTMGAALFAPRLATQARCTSQAARIDVSRRLAAAHPGNVHRPVPDDEVIRLYTGSSSSRSDSSELPGLGQWDARNAGGCVKPLLGGHHENVLVWHQSEEGQEKVVHESSCRMGRTAC